MSTEAPVWLKSAITEIIPEFSDQLISEPAKPYLPGDEFGSLAQHTFRVMMDSTSSYLARHQPEISPALARKIEKEFDVSDEGIGICALLLELVPLVFAKEMANEVLSADGAVQIAQNSYDFIDTMLQAGASVALAIARDWIQPHIGPAEVTFNGAVWQEHLVRPDRLEKFGLSPTADGNALRLDAKGLEARLEELTLTSHIISRRDKVANCPAYLAKDPADGQPYTLRIYEAMTENARRFIYPDFIAIGSMAVQSARTKDAI